MNRFGRQFSHDIRSGVIGWALISHQADQAMPSVEGCVKRPLDNQIDG